MTNDAAVCQCVRLSVCDLVGNVGEVEGASRAHDLGDVRTRQLRIVGGGLVEHFILRELDVGVLGDEVRALKVPLGFLVLVIVVQAVVGVSWLCAFRDSLDRADDGLLKKGNGNMQQINVLRLMLTCILSGRIYRCG